LLQNWDQIWAIITSNLMLMLKSYVPLYDHGIWENTNTNDYSWVSRLPSSRSFQKVMSKLVQNMEYVKTYLDDLLILTNSSFKDHLLKLEKRLARLSKMNRWYEIEHFQI
jgi:hypothetical protein